MSSAIADEVTDDFLLLFFLLLEAREKAEERETEERFFVEATTTGAVEVFGFEDKVEVLFLFLTSGSGASGLTFCEDDENFLFFFSWSRTVGDGER